MGRGRQSCSCRPLHVSVAPHSPSSCATSAPLAPKHRGLAGMGLWGRCDSTFRTEGRSSLCGTMGQRLPVLLRAPGSELHPRARKRCLAAAGIFSSPSEPQTTHITPQIPTQHLAGLQARRISCHSHSGFHRGQVQRSKAA